MSHNDEEYNDSIMLSESLERIAAQAMHLKEKIEAGLQLPSWAEYKVYQAYDAVNKALGTAYPGRYEMEDKKASVFDLVKSAGGGATAQPRERELIGHFKLPIYDGDPGAPGAKVVDHHMHPVFKNEHPGIILGPDAEWVPLSTKKASVFELNKTGGAKRLLRLSAALEKGNAPYSAYASARDKFMRRVGSTGERLVQSTPAGISPVAHHGLAKMLSTVPSEIAGRSRYYFQAGVNPLKAKTWEDVARKAVEKKPSVFALLRAR